MFFAIELDTVTEAVKLAVAPVFMLTAVAAMIGTVAGRLARIIDRARVLEALIEAAPPEKAMCHAFEELKKLRTRGWLVNVCIALLTFSAIFIGLTIVALFLAETTEVQILRFAPVIFLTSVGSYLLALLCFLSETLMATQTLKFGKVKKTGLDDTVKRTP